MKPSPKKQLNPQPRPLGMSFVGTAALVAALYLAAFSLHYLLALKVYSGPGFAGSAGAAFGVVSFVGFLVVVYLGYELTYRALPRLRLSPRALALRTAGILVAADAVFLAAHIAVQRLLDRFGGPVTLQPSSPPSEAAGRPPAWALVSTIIILVTLYIMVKLAVYLLAKRRAEREHDQLFG